MMIDFFCILLIFFHLFILGLGTNCGKNRFNKDNRIVQKRFGNFQ